MIEAIRLARLYAPLDDPVVLSGETGSGKSFLARRIHEWSGRSGSLVEKSTGEIEPGLAFDEVFGHERGAFTGAQSRRAGLFAEAGTGSLLLDDLHLAGRAAQAMLLRALETGTYRRLGTDRGAQLLARVVVGCGVDLDELVRRKVLLPDLRWRLAPFEIRVPALRERLEDIALLAAWFLAAFAAARASRGPKRLAPEVVAAFELASWPGNVRELERTVRAACVHAQDDELIRYEHLPASARLSLRFDRTAAPGPKRRLVRWALWRTQGNVSAAAELIGAHRNTVRAIRAVMERTPSEAGGLRRELPSTS